MDRVGHSPQRKPSSPRCSSLLANGLKMRMDQACVGSAIVRVAVGGITRAKLHGRTHVGVQTGAGGLSKTVGRGSIA